MGCQDSFKLANKVTRFVFFLMIFCNGANWISLTTTSWSVISLPYDAAGDTHVGLWRRCRSNLITDCRAIDGWAQSATYGIVQGMACLGFAAINLGHVVLLLFMFVDRWKQSEETGTGAAVLMISGAFIWTLAAVIYSFGYNELGANYGYSFGFGIGAGGLGLICGLLTIVAARY